MAWQNWVGKKVFIQISTRDGTRRYSGIIEDISFMGKNTESVEVYFISIKDKFGFKVGFVSTQIEVIKEEK